MFCRKDKLHISIKNKRVAVTDATEQNKKIVFSEKKIEMFVSNSKCSHIFLGMFLNIRVQIYYPLGFVLASKTNFLLMANI